MARDIELFELLAESVDTHVDEVVPHRVVVPSADLPAFQHFASTRREIIAQEDVLPVRIWKAPAALRHLAFLRAGFRRPVYVGPGPSIVRGWMLQQLLKIGVTCRAEERAIMHVDSDVAFFRAFRPEDAFAGEKPRFFSVPSQTRNPMHRAWVKSSCDFLGAPTPESHDAHYIENCVLWSTEVTRAMVEQIERCQGKPLHRAIFTASTMSEYYLYGIFADLCGQMPHLHAEEVSFCNSYWPSNETDPVNFAALAAQLQPKHCAIAVQSTHQLPIEDRRALYARVEAEWAKSGGR